MREFRGKIILEKVHDREFAYLVLEPVAYENEKYVIEVAGGWETDGASVPKVFQNIFSAYGEQSIYGAIVHDALYMAEALPRKECDAIFLELLKLKGVGWFKRRVMYRAVRLGGWLVWKKHKPKKVKEAKKFIKITTKDKR